VKEAIAMNKVQSIVIGAGAIGLSTARSLCLKGYEVILIERNSSLGQETSSRNSEVIHAGIYYPKGSLKAKYCVEGKNLLYKYLDDRKIAYNMCGKLIVSTSRDSVPALEALKGKAEANGVDDLLLLDRESARRYYEEHVECIKAIFSPRTGVFDSHAYMEHLAQDIIDEGGNIVYNCSIEQIQLNRSSSSRFLVSTSQGLIECDYVVNAAGLSSPFITRKIIGYPKNHIPRAFYAKGNYFQLSSKSPFQRLVYPLPEVGGLGVHATIDLAGRTRFGPDVEWLKPRKTSDVNNDGAKDAGCKKDVDYEFKEMEDFSYAVDPSRAEKFYAEIRKYWPALPDDSLVADYSGIRPKLCGPSPKIEGLSCQRVCTDFMVHGPHDHGVNGLVCLHGIESPGLTSSLAIGDRISTSMLFY
jgi:L-2-hydroxyglutarate oxidase LhgO